MHYPQIDIVSATDNLCQTSYPFFAVIRSVDELFRYLTAIEEDGNMLDESADRLSFSLLGRDYLNYR